MKQRNFFKQVKLLFLIDRLPFGLKNKSLNVISNKSKRFGKLLNFIDKIRVVSMRAMVLFTIVIVPALVICYWQEYHLYEDSKELIFENVRFGITRSPIGPGSRIHIYNKHGKTIFYSACIGLDNVCRNKRGTTRSAKIIHAMAIEDGRGIVNNITIDNPIGSSESYTNLDSETYIASYRHELQRKNRWRMKVFVIPFITFLMSSFFAFILHRLFLLFHSEEC